MKTYQFKTNINCNGCVAKVTPHLEKIAHIKHWEVDINNENKILTVSGEELQKKDVEQAVKEAGFTLEDKKTGLFGKIFK